MILLEKNINIRIMERNIKDNFKLSKLMSFEKSINIWDFKYADSSQFYGAFM